MPTVLIVDDEEDILWGLSEELSRNGMEVDTASNGQEAFKKLKDNEYDFLITDIRMPGMSGSELLMKAKEVKPDMKVVVMTAYGSDEIKEDVLSKGAISYLEKPFDFEELLQLVKEKSKTGGEETISKLSLNQFIQLVSMEGQSCIISVSTDNGKGKMYFQDGEIINAEFEHVKGEDAFVKIMSDKNPKFDVEWKIPQVKRVIEKPLHALLLMVVAKSEEKEAKKDELSEEVDFSQLNQLFGEDEGVIEEEVKEENPPKEEEVQEEAPEEAQEEIPSEEPSVEVEKPEQPVGVGEEQTPQEEGLSINDLENILEEEVSEESNPSEEEVELVEGPEGVPEESVESSIEEEIEEPKSEEEEELTLDNLESLLEEEVSEEPETPEEAPAAEEVAAEETPEETPAAEEVAAEETPEEAVSEEEKPVKKIPSSGEVQIPEEVIALINEKLKPFVSSNVDIYGMAVLDKMGNIISEHTKAAKLDTKGIYELGLISDEIFGMVSRANGGNVSEIAIYTDKVNLTGFPVNNGVLTVFLVLPVKSMKLAIIKMQAKKIISEIESMF